MAAGKGSDLKMPETFTLEAQEVWQAVPAELQKQVLESVWCPHCHAMTTMIKVTGAMANARSKSLVLRGFCAGCGGNVARVLEGE